MITKMEDGSSSLWIIISQNEILRNPFNKSVGVSMYAIERRFTRPTVGRSKAFKKDPKRNINY